MVSRNRLKAVLIQNTHNHLRLMRILACLSVVGFRIFALNLITFLGFVVFNDREFERQKGTFLRDWKVYDDGSKDSKGTDRKK